MKKFELIGVVAIAKDNCREYNIELLYDEKLKTKIKVECKQSKEYAEVNYYGLSRKDLINTIYEVINSFFNKIHYVLLVDKHFNKIG